MRSRTDSIAASSSVRSMVALARMPSPPAALVAATGFELVVPDGVPETRTPTPDELELIRVVIDPHNLRDQEVPNP